jgi:hypothetical protein
MLDSKIVRYLILLIQFLPLSTFSTYAYWSGEPSNDRWVDAFIIGGVLGIVQLAMILYFARRSPLNRLVLAANLYLIVGGIACVMQWWDFMSLYATAMESAILGLMVVVGLVSTLFSRYGFIGVKIGPQRQLVKQYSFILLGSTLVAFAASLIFRGDSTFAAVIPIIFLAVILQLLKHRIKKHSQSGLRP